ncbi:MULTISPECIES: hypothetical protein [unclassified Streptomyces]|uniref:hypothetical protein n=1 Tax=unclassified Streptomyces TaxID=2593676 RepID=UPI0035D9145D
MIPSDTRLALIDRATDLLGTQQLNPATHSLLVRHLRRDDIDVREWHRCSDIARSGNLTHHQARAAAARLVAVGLLDRNTVYRRRHGEGVYVVYRVPQPSTEGAAQ